MNRLARGRLHVRCDTCGRYYATGRHYRRPPFPCSKCEGTVRRETIAEQRQRLDARAQFLADALETMRLQRFNPNAQMPSHLYNRPWNQGGSIVREARS